MVAAHQSARGRGPELVDRPVSAARNLGAEPDSQTTLDAAVMIAAQNINGVDAAAISLIAAGGTSLQTPAYTDDLALAGDLMQHQLREGPCLDAVWREALVHSHDLIHDIRWPVWGPQVARELGAASMLCFQLFTHDGTVGALNLYSRTRGAFAAANRDEGWALAVHIAVAVAVAAARAIENLNNGLASRALIGQATGVLVERYHLTPDLDALPWDVEAWSAGAWVDALGTALVWNREGGHPSPRDADAALTGWLVARADPATGVWGRESAGDLLQVVNGSYRAGRGTLVQRGLPVTHADRLVDTVLRHASDSRHAAPHVRDACTVLDIAHPLWPTRAGGYRAEEVQVVARDLLEHALTLWVPGRGVAFRAPRPDGSGGAACASGRQGTEMWTAIVWLLADIVGLAHELGYRPAGVHRPEARPRFPLGSVGGA